MGPVVSVAEQTTAELRFTVPLFATPAWILAVTAAEGVCQCTGQCGRKHTRMREEIAARCSARQGAPGVMLHLTEGGTVLCLRCFESIDRAAARAAKNNHAAPNPDQLDMLALLD